MQGIRDKIVYVQESSYLAKIYLVFILKPIATSFSAAMWNFILHMIHTVAAFHTEKLLKIADNGSTFNNIFIVAIYLHISYKHIVLRTVIFI